MPPEPRPSPPFTAARLAQRLGAELDGPGDLALTHLDAAHRAGPGALTFIRSSDFVRAWETGRASAALVTRGVAASPRRDPPGALLIVADADLALNTALELFAPARAEPAPGVHPGAWVDPLATVAPTASIGPGCVVSAGARVGEGAALHAGVFLGPGASVGAGSVLHAGVRVLDRCVVGRACILWPGVVVGADGFGYRPAPDGRGLIKVPHIGAVEIGDAVEIGANTCIDRAKFGATTIGDGTKIDNLVQIGHNCVVGRACIICGHSALAGSVEIGDGAVLAGDVAIADRVRVGPRARLAAGAGVMHDIPPGQTWWGAPAQLFRDQARCVKAFRRLPEAIRRLEQLEEQARALWARLGGAPAPPDKDVACASAPATDPPAPWSSPNSA